MSPTRTIEICSRSNRNCSNVFFDLTRYIVRDGLRLTTTIDKHQGESRQSHKSRQSQQSRQQYESGSSRTSSRSSSPDRGTRGRPDSLPMKASGREARREQTLSEGSSSVRLESRGSQDSSLCASYNAQSSVNSDMDPPRPYGGEGKFFFSRMRSSSFNGSSERDIPVGARQFPSSQCINSPEVTTTMPHAQSHGQHRPSSSGKEFFLLLAKYSMFDCVSE